MQITRTGLVALGIAFASPLALAGEATGTFSSTFEVEAACMIVVADTVNVDFGDVTQTPVATTGRVEQTAGLINVLCTPNAVFDFFVDGGLYSGAVYSGAPVGPLTTNNIRRMRRDGIGGTGSDQAADYIEYNLFQNSPQRNRPYFINQGEGPFVSDPALDNITTFDFFGRLPTFTSNNKNVGTYSDLITVTVRYE